jgi:hypothetical protein
MACAHLNLHPDVASVPEQIKNNYTGIGQENKKGMPAASVAHQDGGTPHSTSCGCFQRKAGHTCSCNDAM